MSSIHAWCISGSSSLHFLLQKAYLAHQNLSAASDSVWFCPWWPASWWHPSVALLWYALGTMNNLVSVASPGGVALMYSLLLMMTRCFCWLIRANPSLVLANSPRSVLREGGSICFYPSNGDLQFRIFLLGLSPVHHINLPLGASIGVVLA